MSYSHLAPPQELPDHIVETLEKCSPELLQHVAHYADELAEYREREARLAEEADEEAIEEQPEDRPDDVPTKATTTIKEINGNRYYYWQWRDGNQIKSQYKSPVTPDE